MAQTMKNVKAISIPVNGAMYNVKKLEDSNGNIIWGSPSAFPYRRLEYIHFNGTDNYIDFGSGKPSFNRIDTIIESVSNVSNNATNGGYSQNGAWQRYYLPRFANNNTLRFSIGSVWSKYMSYIDNKKYKFIFKTGSTFSSDVTCELRDGDTDALIDSDVITPSQQSGGTAANNPVIYIGATYVKSTGPVYFLNCNFYLWRRTALDGTSNLYHAYPAQRKSDGAIGILWPQNGRFLVMQGTVNSSSIGPIVDEYWDGTDPNA